MSAEFVQWMQQRFPKIVARFQGEHPGSLLGVANPAEDPGWKPPKNAPWQDPTGKDVRPTHPKTGEKLSHHPDGRPITARDPHPHSPDFTRPADPLEELTPPDGLEDDPDDDELEKATRPAQSSG